MGDTSGAVSEHADGKAGEPSTQPSTSRTRRNMRRAMSWRRGRGLKDTPDNGETGGKEGAGKEARKGEGPAVEKKKKEGMRKWISWVKGVTMLGSADKPEPDGGSEADSAEKLKNEASGGQTGSKGPWKDPAATYRRLELDMRMARLEEHHNTVVALRYLVRKKHARGGNICFPIPGAVARLQLKCAGLPTDVEELHKLTLETFRRRGEELNLEEVYEDFVRAHGRTLFDSQKTSPDCYIVCRQP